MEKIECEIPILRKQCEFIKTHGACFPSILRAPRTDMPLMLCLLVRTGGPSPDVVAIATAELLDAIGSLHTAAEALKVQLAQTQHNLDEKDPRIALVHHKLKREQMALETAFAMVAKWGAQLDPYLAAMPTETARFLQWCTGLPLAATDPTAPSIGLTDLTVQRVIGACVVTGDPRAASALEVFNRRRAAETQRIVPIILNDVRAYTHALQQALADPAELAASQMLRRIEGTEVPQTLDGVGLSSAQVAALTGADQVSDRYALEYAVQKRMEATTGSITLYRLICGIAESVDLPGGVPFVVPGAFADSWGPLWADS